MNALRTLPILNRPSRPASPAPPGPTTQVTTSTATGHPSQPSGAADPRTRARSLSRQITDKVAGLQINQPPNGAGVVVTITPSQPVGAKKGSSPPGSRPTTPWAAPGPLGPAAAPSDAAAPQGGYMDVLGLRLNESVNKACVGVDYKAKKGFRKGAGWTVGESVVKELPYPPSDAYLIRAVLRTAVRSLSIYATRLESLLLPALTDASFGSPLNLTAHSPSAFPLNPVQHFAVSVAHAAWETCEVLEQTLETGKWPKFVSEALRPVMDKLDLVVGKVNQPILLGLKRDLVASISRTEGTSPPGGKVVGLASIPAPTGPNVPVSRENSMQPSSRLAKEVSGGGHPRSLAIPTCLQHFAARVDGARKALEFVAAPCADDGEGWITGVVVAVVWKGMCIISEKDLTAPGGRPPSPGSVSKALHNLSKEKDGHAPTASNHYGAAGLGGVTAKLTNGLSILPSRSASRPPSPPRSKLDGMTHALMSFEALVKRLANGLVQPPNSTPPSDPHATEHLAREALHEALEALTSCRLASAAMGGPHGPARILGSLRRVRDDIDDESEEALDDALEDLPAVVLFAVLHRQANAALSHIRITDEKLGHIELRLKTPAEVYGWSRAEFEKQVLSGFGAAEEWGRRVAVVLKGEVERVLGELGRIVAHEHEGNEGGKVSRETREAGDWVRALGVAAEARAGIKVVGA